MGHTVVCSRMQETCHIQTLLSYAVDMSTLTNLTINSNSLVLNTEQTTILYCSQQNSEIMLGQTTILHYKALVQKIIITYIVS